MKKKFAPILLAIAALVALPLYANAATKTYTLNLDGTKELPANGSVAVGSADLTINLVDPDNEIYSIDFLLVGLHLTGLPTGAHIHMAPAGSNGDIVFDLGGNATDGGPIFGIPETFGLVGSGVGIDHDLAEMILATPWNFYINLHTVGFPAGEIRGQLSAVPLPSALWLFGAAVAGVSALRRRHA